MPQPNNPHPHHAPLTQTCAREIKNARPRRAKAARMSEHEINTRPRREEDARTSAREIKTARPRRAKAAQVSARKTATPVTSARAPLMCETKTARSRAPARALETLCALALVFGGFAVLGYFLADAPAWLFRPAVYGVTVAATLFGLFAAFAPASRESAPDGVAPAPFLIMGFLRMGAQRNAPQPAQKS